MEKSLIYLKGTFWKRFIAFIVDEIIIFLCLFILFFIFELIGIKTDELSQVIFWIITVTYNSLLIYKSGATIGKRLLRLRVITTEYKPITLSQAILRESLGKLYSTIFFYLGYIHVLKNPQRQTWHDKLLKTYVVTVDDKGQYIPISDEKISRKDKITYWILFFVAIMPLILSIFVIIYLFFGQPLEIKGKAMEPNYIEGEFYLSDKISYRFSEPKRGDVIIFKAPNNPEIDYFKRIIGLPEEVVEIRDGKVYINDQVLEEPYLKSETITYTYQGGFINESQTIEIPQNQYFVLGDNRERSSDSREFGPVPKEVIIGKMIFCYWSCSSKK